MLALDLRGHGGSDGEWTTERCRARLRHRGAAGPRRRRRARRVVAAGRTAVLALEAAAAALADPLLPLADSLVLVSPRGARRRRPAALRAEGLAMLLLHGAAGRAGGRRRGAPAARGASAGRVSVSFGSELQGTALLTGPPAKHVADKMGSFLRERAVVGGPGLKRARAADVSG